MGDSPPKNNESANIFVYPEKVPTEESNITEAVPSVSEQIHVKEPDSLVQLDQEKITVIDYTLEELTRLFRALKGLTPVQTRLIEVRYVNLIRFYEKRIPNVDRMYHTSRLFISIGGVAVPALLSIQSPSYGNSNWLYWFTWAVSISVTICHNVGTLLRLDKKYFGIHATLERLKTEGIQYLELSGHYSGHHGHGPPTHENQYIYFVNSVERIRQRQIEEEYSSAREYEKIVPGTVPAKQGSSAEQIVPSPMDLNLNRNAEKNVPNK